MNSVQFTFCRALCYLDWIPRYGRFYSYKGDLSGLRNRGNWTKHWCYQQHGRWGTSLLDRMGLLWKFIDENERRHDLRQAKLQEPEAQVADVRESLGLAAIGILLLLSILALILTFRGL